jgi:hypothetical protein
MHYVGHYTVSITSVILVLDKCNMQQARIEAKFQIVRVKEIVKIFRRR